MKKIPHTFIAAIALSLSIGFAPVATGQEAIEQQLIKQIQYGESLYRDDIINEAVQRLYRLQPDHPDGLLAEIRLSTRLGNIEHANQQLLRLKATAPNSKAAKEGALLVYLTSEEAEQTLAKARLLAAVGQYDEALLQFDHLLKGIYPSPDLAREYWTLYATQTTNYQKAIQELNQSLKQFPGNAALQKALVELHFTTQQPEYALSTIRQLAKHATDRQWAADREYEYLISLPVSDFSRKKWQDYVLYYADVDTVHQRAQARLEQQNQLLNDPAWRAGQSGLALIADNKNPTKARQQLQQAIQAYPNDPQLIGALGSAYLRTGNRVQALRHFKQALEAEKADDLKSKWISLIASTEHWLTLERAATALKQGDEQLARQLYQKALSQQPNDLFSLVGLGNSYMLTKQMDKAWEYFQRALRKQPNNEMVQRAVLRYINWQPLANRSVLLQNLPTSMQNSPLVVAAKHQYELEALQLAINEAREQQQWPQLINLLRKAQAMEPDNTWTSYDLARVLRDQGDITGAFDAYEVHRKRQPDSVATHYAYALLLASVDRLQPALAALDEVDPKQWTQPMFELKEQIEQTVLLQRANQLYEDNDYTQAYALYQELKVKDQLPAYMYSNMVDAWLAQGGDAQTALDNYAQGMVAANILAPEALTPQRDNKAFTYAMRNQETDTWLESGLRSSAEQLYQQQNPTVQIHNDFGWRTDGTPGLSKLRSNTVIVQLNYPIKHGTGFIRMDHVNLDTGTLPTNAQGVYEGEFGTCSSGAGCTTHLRQKAQGTGAAIGWSDDQIEFDLGLTPQGFTVTNWAGGLSYGNKWNTVGWRLTASRRPMSNSLLSFAGATDPRTGEKWGGVMATGLALGLSRDQGEENGLWADISHHQLTGQQVERNNRTRIMAGYYRRLINKPHELLTVGVNAMHWRYKKDLGDYSFKQGGYYSPKQYNSLSLPIRYAKRTDNWSIDLRGGVSLSHAQTHTSDSNRGMGHYLQGGVERRMGDHWILGAAADVQHSKDYTPSRAMLYLRYYFEPWKGNLPLGLNPLLPYAEFK